MTAYAIAYLREVDFNADIVEYLQRIDATLDDYGGRFLVHGGTLTPAEGKWDGDVVVIEFPDGDSAAAWYDSPGYLEILPLRVDNSTSVAALLEGVPVGYRATDGLAAMLAADPG
ncbi:MAG: DUF1330 domain-containing protein [Marmoricola sp.]